MKNTKPLNSEVATLADVAQIACVSTATVSRCLNNPVQVSDKTRQRVMKAVRTLNYSPNFGARALAAKRTNTYGAIIPTMENAIFARGLQAFEQVLVSRGATMLVASSSYDPQIEEDQIRTLIARGADGLLLIGRDREPDVYRFLRERNVPFVIAWTSATAPETSHVGFDNLAASRALAARAIGLGHRQIGFISADLNFNDRARDRVEGVRLAMRDHGLDSNGLPIIETRYSIACGRAAMVAIMTDHPETTLVMCGNDVLAVGAVQGAHLLGLRVPDDVSITGFDDIELATIISPALTTVHVPHHTMGTMAAETLLEMVREGATACQIVLETSIVERESLSAPRMKPLSRPA